MPDAGLSGLLDFTGYSVGQGEAVPSGSGLAMLLMLVKGTPRERKRVLRRVRGKKKRVLRSLLSLQKAGGKRS